MHHFQGHGRAGVDLWRRTPCGVPRPCAHCQAVAGTVVIAAAATTIAVREQQQQQHFAASAPPLLSESLAPHGQHFHGSDHRSRHLRRPAALAVRSRSSMSSCQREPGRFTAAIRLTGMRLPAGQKTRNQSLMGSKDCGQKQIRKHDDYHGSATIIPLNGEGWCRTNERTNAATTLPWLRFIGLEPPATRSRARRKKRPHKVDSNGQTVLCQASLLGSEIQQLIAV